MGYLPSSVLQAEPIAEDGADANVTASNDDSGAAAGMLVINDCPSSVKVAFYYQSANGWEGNDALAWDYDPGERSFPTLAGTRLQPTTSEIYFALFKDGRPAFAETSRKFVRIAGINLSLHLAQVSRSSGDVYEARIYCDQ